MLTHVDCPYCGEAFDTEVDTSAGSQDYIEDCPVCCRPIEFHLDVSLAGETFTLTAGRDDE
ncbi:MAG: CPXCG motif-containing cysteine-rich protein [Gammaproteobacteria bacterium]|nr:CPXCG motif-containing cysteine-rich protein [Gammaproteobacteria bacterium]